VQPNSMVPVPASDPWVQSLICPAGLSNFRVVVRRHPEGSPSAACRRLI